MKPGQQMIVATGFKPLKGDFVIKKRLDVVTKVTRKGFEIGKLKFDFNGHQKQKQQTSVNSVLSVAMPISMKEAAMFRLARKARISEKKSLVRELKAVNKELDRIEKQLDKIQNTPFKKLAKL